MIRNLEERGVLHGISIERGAPKISHLFVTGDSFIFIKANQMESSIIKETLDKYGRASRQFINFEKSAISFSANTCSVVRELVKNTLQISSEGVNGNYLGLPTMIGRNKRSILGFIKDRILKRMQSWTNWSYLEQEGRFILRTLFKPFPCML